MKNVTPGWKHVAIVTEDQPVDLDGMDPWQNKWHPVHEPEIVVAHPSYPLERHPMSVYELRDGEKRVKFAAGEYSNGVWGFYLPIGCR